MTKRVGIMTPYAFTKARFLALTRGETRFLIGQPKLNGDRARAVEGDLVSSSGAIRTSVPRLTESLYQLGQLGILDEFDGELYIHGETHNNIRSIVSRTKNLHPDHKRVRYCIYDLVSQEPQQARLDRLANLSLPSLFDKVPSVAIRTLAEFDLYYTQFLSLGYEGIILRDPDQPYQPSKVTWLLKQKPSVSDSFLVIGFEEEISIHGQPKNALGALWLQTLEGTPFKVGTGFTKEQRQLWWQHPEALLGRYAKIRFAQFSDARGVPEKASFEDLLCDTG